MREQAYVEFSIGYYHDRVLCDVTLMTCCHIILGRPWQALRRTLHDGLENTYLVHKGNGKFFLIPLGDDKEQEHLKIFFGSKEAFKL